EGIGRRLNVDWMAGWILDPKSLRPTASMPKLLRGAGAKEDAEAIAAYLSSLRGNVAASSEGRAEPEQRGDGKSLFEKFQCGACHDPVDNDEHDPQKTSLKHVREKFAAGKLAEFLQAPEAHYAWTRMPNFRLSGSEAKALADTLLAAAPKAHPLD